MSQSAWTTADTRLLADCAEAGLSAKQTASVLRRSLISVKAKARHSGLNFASRAPNPKPPVIVTEEDADRLDKAHVASVLKANVYGFGRTIIATPDIRRIGGVV